jgi:phage gpG-like protein
LVERGLFFPKGFRNAKPPRREHIAMTVFSLIEFAAKLAVAEVNMEIATREVLAAACAILADEAKQLIGVPHAEWPALAAVTLERKDGVNSPLLESGAMRDSIGWNSDAHEGYVGSNDHKLIWHEFGSDKRGNAWGGPNPPRPVLGLALMKKEQAIHAMASRAAMAAILGGGAFTAEMAELVHLMREFGRMVREAGNSARDALTPDDNDRKYR